MKLRLLIVLVCLGLATGVAQAATVTLSDYLHNSGNSALVGSDLGFALFGNDEQITNNVALYSLSVAVAGSVRFDSNGFAAGGVDPYFSLFLGSGNTATFFGSNYDQAVTTGGDFDLSYALSAGNYMVAIGAYANMSLAENYGSGTLNDGFTSLGAPQYLGIDKTYYYELSITTPDQPGSPVPEPSTMLLLGAGLAGLVAYRKKLKG